MKSNFLQDWGVLIALAVLVAINIGTPGSAFLQPENLRNLVSQSAIVGMIALGMTFVIITGGIDLSVGSLAAMSGAGAMLALNKFGASGEAQGVMAACLASIGIGLAAGLFNGVLVAYGRVAPFIVTLAGLAGFRSVALVLGDGGEIRSTVPSFQSIGFGGVPIPGTATAGGQPVTLYWSAVAFLVLAVLAGLLLNRTRFGRYAVAVGANERAAHYSAIDTRRIKVAVYAMLGFLTGLAAFFLAARMNSVGTGSVGLYYELDAIAAVVIGGTSLRGGRGRIWGTVVGILMLTLISNMMTAYRIDTDWQGLVRGAVILVAVLLQSERKN